MIKFDILRGRAVPLFEDNIDTDQLCPKQHLSAIQRIGFGAALFSDRRWEPDGSLRQDFVLNRAEYADANIMIGGLNFGSGSSREHAVWALVDYGIRCVVAPSFGDIFLQNSVNNGLLAIALPTARVATLAAVAESKADAEWTIDLPRQLIIAPTVGNVDFTIDPARKERLLGGLDEVAMTLRHSADIRHVQDRQRLTEPWLWTQS